MQLAFVKTLQTIREEADFPMVIVEGGGYRCPKHNKKVGGKKGSRHIKGLAVDVKFHSSREMYRLLELAFKYNLRGIGINRTTIHMDGRDSDGVGWHYY